MVDPNTSGSLTELTRQSGRLKAQTALEKKAGKQPAQESTKTPLYLEAVEDEDEENSELELSIKDVQRQIASLVN